MQGGFASPAQAEGTWEAEGLQWALLIFHHPSGAFNLTLAAGAAQTNTTVLQQGREGPGDREANPIPLPVQEKRFASPVQGIVAPTGPWASLFVLADAIALSARAPTAANLVHAAAGDSATRHLPALSIPADTTSPTPPPAFRLQADHAAVSAQAARPGAFAATLHATGVRHVSWHNATVRCVSAACPDAGTPWGMSIDALGRSSVQRLSYIDLEATGGTLDGSATPWAMAAGGPAVDLRLHGRLRLPDARMAGGCSLCPAGETYLAEGNLTLAGLAPDPGRADGLLAGLGGSVQSAALDETPAPWLATPGVAAGATAAVGVGLLAWWALFARSARPPALGHPRRRAIHNAIRSQPGLSFRALQRHLELHTGTLEHHLKRLVDARVVVARPHGNTVRYFENHGRYDGTWRQVAQLLDPEARRLHAWLLENPGAGQAAVVAAAREWGRSRTATQRRLAGLLRAGLLEDQGEGRTSRYLAKPAVEASA
jgi:DNA-binding transcriptional ArsR family regulator